MATKKKPIRKAPARKAPARKAKTAPGRKTIEVAVRKRRAMPIPADTYGQAGQFVWGNVVVGSESKNNVEMSYKVTGLNLQNIVPAAIFLHPRQSDNSERGWLDVFATQIVQTDRDFMEIRIIRLDQPLAGWGQDLQIDYFIVDVPG